jgi:hypothetical protein
LGVGLAFLLDVSPGASGAAWLAFGARFGAHVEARVSLLGTLPVANELGGGSFTSALFGGRVDLCLGAALDDTRVGGCVGSLVAAHVASGMGFVENHTVVDPFAAALGGPFAAFAIGDTFVLHVGLEAVVSLYRPSVYVDGAGGGRVAEATLPPIGAMLRVEAAFVLP